MWQLVASMLIVVNPQVTKVHKQIEYGVAFATFALCKQHMKSEHYQTALGEWLLQETLSDVNLVFITTANCIKVERGA